MMSKRKRTNTLAPQLDTVIADRSHNCEPDSPRSKVAEKLGALRIDPPAPGALVDPHVSKKRHVRYGGAVDVYYPSSQDDPIDSALFTPPKDRLVILPSRSLHDEASDGHVFEIGETPGAYDSGSTGYPSSPPRSSTYSPSPLELDGAIPVAEEADAVDNVRGRNHGPQNSDYRNNSHTSAGRITKFGGPGVAAGEWAVATPTKTGRMKALPTSTTQRKKAKCATTPITSPPPSTPITSPRQEDAPAAPTSAPGQHLVGAKLAAVTRMLSVPTLPLDRTLLPSSAEKQDTPSTSPQPQPQPAPGNADVEMDISELDPSETTWQDSEITGHLWNPAQDADDDGEGINGIGFRPTAAMEWKRREGRKKQVSEWHAREAREERRRRIERRRRGSGAATATATATPTAAANAGAGAGIAEVAGLRRDEQPGKKARVRFAEAG